MAVNKYTEETIKTGGGDPTLSHRRLKKTSKNTSTAKKVGEGIAKAAVSTVAGATLASPVNREARKQKIINSARTNGAVNGAVAGGVGQMKKTATPRKTKSTATTSRPTPTTNTQKKKLTKTTIIKSGTGANPSTPALKTTTTNKTNEKLY